MTTREETFADDKSIGPQGPQEQIEERDCAGLALYTEHVDRPHETDQAGQPPEAGCMYAGANDNTEEAQFRFAQGGPRAPYKRR
jgi:hypothetical protein